MAYQQIKDTVQKKLPAMVADAIALGNIEGINPRMGGSGEYQRILWLKGILDKSGIAYETFEAEDDAVLEGKRYSIIVKVPGSEETDKTLWFIAHLDTVGAGDLTAWNTDPFVPTQIGDKLFGLGVEDNGQAVVSILHTLQLVRELGLKPKCNLGFIFAADEETGSEFGLRAMVQQGLFSPKDEAVVPDAGSGDGSFIEVAEKSVLWVEFTVLGRQAHGSMPHLGINASSVGARLGVELEDFLREKYAYKDDLFDPPYSTFEFTQKLANVDSPNILPGKDVFAVDMRILPKFSVQDVLDDLNRIVSKYEYQYNVKISYRFPQRADAAPVTPPDSKVASSLAVILGEAGVRAYCGGIGGGTCGAILREVGIPSVVWSTLDELAHQPNEYLIVDNLVKDTSVFLALIQKYS